MKKLATWFLVVVVALSFSGLSFAGEAKGEAKKGAPAEEKKAELKEKVTEKKAEVKEKVAKKKAAVKEKAAKKKAAVKEKVEETKK